MILGLPPADPPSQAVPIASPALAGLAGPDPRGPFALSPARARAASLIFFFLLTVVATWPLALMRQDVFYTRQFDLYSSLWLYDNLWSLLPHMVSTTTAWPLGENLTRPDAWLFLLFSLPASLIMSSRAFVALFVLLGQTLTGYAAERCASRGLGIAFPWSLLAGVVFAYNGLSATAWAEGHVYFLFNPWLPLLLLALLRLTSPGGGPRDALLAGVAWSLGLLTSAYVGIFGLVLIAVMLARGWFVRLDRRPELRSVAWLVAGSTLFSAVYVWQFLIGSGQQAPRLQAWNPVASVNLTTLATWAPQVDLLTHHSIAAPLGMATLALLAFAPLVLRRQGGWRTLLGLALAMPLLGMGTHLRVGMGDYTAWATPLASLVPAQVTSFFHFPVRLMWLYYLCAGVVAAQVAQALARQAGWKWALPLLLGVVVDGLLFTGAPVRAQPVLAKAPSAYLQAPADRPILDLFSDAAGAGGADDTLFDKLSLYYQTFHRRPILSPALAMHEPSPRELVSRRLLSQIRDWAEDRQTQPSANLSEAKALLLELGIGAVAVHLELIRYEEQALVLEGLTHIAGPPAATSRDAGQIVILFALPALADAEPIRAYQSRVLAASRVRTTAGGASGD